MSSLIFIPRRTQTLGENDFSLLVNENRVADGDGVHMLATALNTTFANLTPFSDQFTLSIWLKSTFDSPTSPPFWSIPFSEQMFFVMDVSNQNPKQFQIVLPLFTSDQLANTLILESDNPGTYPFSNSGVWSNIVIIGRGTAFDAPPPKVFSNGTELAVENGTWNFESTGGAIQSPTPISLISAGDSTTPTSVPPNTGFRGNLGHFAIWDTILDAANISEIANPTSGKPFDLDLRTNSGNYTASSSLVEYWKPGAIEDTARFGESFIPGRNHLLSNGGPDFEGLTSAQGIPLTNRMNDVPL